MAHQDLKVGDFVTIKKLRDKKIIAIDTEKQEALCEGLNGKNEKKTVSIPLRLLKLKKEKTGTMPTDTALKS